MKKIIFLLLIISSTFSYSQIGNQQENLGYYFLDTLTGWIVKSLGEYPNENNVTLRTTDGGESWIIIQRDSVFRGIKFVNEEVGFATTGLSHFRNPRSLYKTTNKGDSWEYVNGSLILDFKFIDSEIGYSIINFNDGIYFCKSLDGGKTWNKFSYIGNEEKHDVLGQFLWVIDKDNIIIVNQFDIVKSTDGGKEWFNILSAPGRGQYASAHFSGICFADSKVGFISFVGEEGAYNIPDGYWRTTNSGETWNAIPPYKNIMFVDSVGYKEGYPLFRTTNRGETWDSVHYDPGFFLFPDEVKGFAIRSYYGDMSKFVFCKTTDGGYSWDCDTFTINIPLDVVDISLDLKYNLQQNFPNPFNPGTTINYTIAKEGVSSLIVYDLLGREVSKLFDEFKAKGNYSLDFNASGLPSGIYFYQLKSEGYTSTKKMVVLK